MWVATGYTLHTFYCQQHCNHVRHGQNSEMAFIGNAEVYTTKCYKNTNFLTAKFVHCAIVFRITLHCNKTSQPQVIVVFIASFVRALCVSDSILGYCLFFIFYLYHTRKTRESQIIYVDRIFLVRPCSIMISAIKYNKTTFIVHFFNLCRLNLHLQLCTRHFFSRFLSWQISGSTCSA